MFNKRFWSENKYLIGLLTVAFMLRVWGIDFGLPDFFPHTDETFALAKAMYFFEPAKRPEFAVTIFHLWGWLLYQILSMGKIFINFPPDKELTTAEFMWWARLISALMSTGSVGLIYLIGKKIWDEKVALLSALFLAVTFIDVQTAHYFRQDTYIQFLGLLLLYAYLVKPQKIFLWAFLLGAVSSLRVTAWVYLIPIIADWWFNNKINWMNKLGDLVKIGLLSVGGWATGHPDAFIQGTVKQYLIHYFNFFTNVSFNWVGGDTSNKIPNYVWWFKYLNYTGLFVTMFTL